MLVPAIEFRHGTRGGMMTERAPDGMRRFTMRREFDVSGVSGTGIVLEGVHFSTGVVVIHWLTPPPRGSISVFDDLEQFLSIHVRPHPDNRTVLTFEDGEEVVCAASGPGELEEPVFAGTAPADPDGSRP
jgi:hypothetical protein